MNETEFIQREMRVWGEDHITNLLDSGYSPVLTTAGWRWVYEPANKVVASERIASS